MKDLETLYKELSSFQSDIYRKENIIQTIILLESWTVHIPFNQKSTKEFWMDMVKNFQDCQKMKDPQEYGEQYAFYLFKTLLFIKRLM